MTVGGVIIMLALASLPGEGRPLAVKPMVRVAAAELRVRDLVEAPAGGLPARIGAMIVARLPQGASEIELSSTDVAALVRRRVPGMRVLAPLEGRVRVVSSGRVAPLRARGACFATVVAVQAGAALSAADVRETECLAGRAAVKLRYDRAGVACAAAPLAAGAYLGRLAPLAERAIGKGMPLVLRSASGPVTIERPVTAVQPGRSGAKLFVRDANGQVFSAPLTLADKEHRP